MREPGAEEQAAASAAAEPGAAAHRNEEAAESAASAPSAAGNAELPVLPAARVAQLQQQLDQVRGEAAEHLTRLARVQADFDNFRRRAQREREEVEQYAALALVRDLLPVLDNMERALAAAAGTIDTVPDGAPPAGGGDSALRSGVELILRQFRDLLEKAGVAAVPGAGEPFDPNWHEAVVRVDGDLPVPTVVEEFQRGYRMGNRLVRPSMVKVASRS